MRRRRLLGGGKFSPLALFKSGAKGAWYDPSDFSTLFQDSAGTTPVTATGQSVGKILDKSGNGNHATQATAASQPTLQQTAGGLYYLSLDGSNDSMATASIDFSGTDKMLICAGITKNSDAALGIVAELSASVSTNNGTFNLGAPYSPVSKRFDFISKGTVLAEAPTTSTTYNAPYTGVISGIGDIAGDVCKLRINASEIVSISTDQGTGNYGNYPLYIGRRNNASLPFNGRIYQMIVCGKSLSASELSSVEKFVNGKTGAY